LQQITNVASYFAKPSDAEISEKPTELQLKCGSKIAAIIETIRDIQSGEGAASEKCVVFIQWDNVLASLVKALGSVGMSALTLHGSTLQRQAILRQFMDNNDLESSILLLSLQQSPSGMNLVCARNLLLVHPMFARNKDEAINFERQAIGRVVRQGQRHKVRIYRFVTRGTVEEDITRRHHSKHFSAAMAANPNMEDAAAGGLKDTKGLASVEGKQQQDSEMNINGS
jgi:SNF2 family DNA or RNA helicase